MKKLSQLEPVVVIDATDERFPYLDPDTTKERMARGRWRAFKVNQCTDFGLQITVRRYFAFLSDDGIGWDYCEGMNDARPHQQNDPWDYLETKELDKVRRAALDIWNGFSDDEKGWFEIICNIPYERIIDIDDEAGIHHQEKYIFVDSFDPVRGPFDDYKGDHFSDIVVVELWSVWST